MGKEIVRRFSATPVKETPEEDSALQAIPLQEQYCLWIETCMNDTAEAAKAKYYLYLNGNSLAFLVCEVRVNAEFLGSIEAGKIRNFTESIYTSGMKIESVHKILPEGVRETKNEPYCFRRMSNAIGRWLYDIKLPRTA